MNRAVKPSRNKLTDSILTQLSLFDTLFSPSHFDTVSTECVEQLFSKENMALGGIAEAMPSVRDYFRIMPTMTLVPRGQKGKLVANIEAIKTAKAVLTQSRPATDAERAVMVQYTGWGGLASVWNESGYAACVIARECNAPVDAEFENWAKTYGPSRLQLDELLTREEIQQAERSTLSAFYTSRDVITPIWSAIERLGFKGGDILEPAAGMGHFIGLMPIHLRDRSRITAIEKDTVSGQLLSQLYPEATVHRSGFEDCELGADSFDLVIGNVPFGAFKVYDRQNRDLSNYPIHNYFIGRSCRLVRPGGIVALITSSGTMDAAGREFRQQLITEGMELVGAIRLPSSAFAENGTEVTSDILFLQKRADSQRRFTENTFMQTVTVRTVLPEDEESDDEVKAIAINEYYAQRPVMMLGDMFFADEVGKGGLHREDRQTLFLADVNTFGSLFASAIEAMPTAIFTAIDKNPLSAIGQQSVNRYSAYTQAVKTKGRSYTQTVVIREYDKLKAVYRDLLGAEIKGEADEITEPLRASLTYQYEYFTRAFGTLTNNRAINFLHEWDGQFTSVQALETIERVNGAGRQVNVYKSAIFAGRVYPLELIADKINTVEDALQLSLYAKGRIDLDFMARKLDKPYYEFEPELITTELVYRDPVTLKLIERATYLSGDVRSKLKIARQIALEQPLFQVNVIALEKAQPSTIPFALIAFQLGSVWLPLEVITDFINKTLEMVCMVSYSRTAAQYKVDQHSGYSIKNQAMGTKERKALELIESALNNRSVIVTKTIVVGGEDKTVKDVEATSMAIQAQEVLQELFVEFGREHYAEKIEKEFNERFNSFVMKAYERPRVAHYPGANTDIFLRDHQFKGVERCKDQDLMLAHVVGSGKTWTMITAAMELKRLGKINKAIIAVQNSTVQDFGRAWKTLYPAALIYVPEKADLEASNRSRFLHRIATNNFDGIVLPNSFLKLIPDDPTDVEALIQGEIAQLTARMGDMYPNSRKKAKTVKEINRKKQQIETKRKMQGGRVTDNMLHFGQLGVDFIALDEAHTYKRLGFSTHRRNIKGIDTQGSETAWQALTKCRTVQRKGGRVVLATGTPISNTMAEAWTMLRFIAEERLSNMCLSTFDQFAGTFGQIIPSFELTTTGQFKAVDRFAKFINVRQLSELYRSHVDVILNDDIPEFKRDNTLPSLKEEKFTSLIIPQAPGVQVELERIREEIRAFEKMSGADKKENSHIPLVMFGQARKATLDIRLLDVTNPDEEGSKVNAAVTKVYDIYQQSNKYKGTQLVFADTYQSPAVSEMFLDEDSIYLNPNYGRARFNLFEDMKAKLIGLGLAETEVAIVPTEANRREPIFDKVRTGEVRVLLGTSERMGVGVNVQERLAAIHHLDAPNRPTDFEQRNGRGIRQGNLHAVWGIPIEIVTYGVDKTLDATAYGRMAIKQRFINQVLKGDVSNETMEDVSSDDDFSSMSFDQMMATLSGSQYALMYTAKNHELQRLYQQRKNYNRGLIDAKCIVERADREIELVTGRLPQLEMEKELVESKFPDMAIYQVEIEGQLLTEGWGAYLDQYAQTLKSRAKRGQSAKGVLKVNGLTIGLEGGMLDYDHEGRAIYGITYSWGLTLRASVTTGPGIITSLRTQLGCVVSAPEAASHKLTWNTKIITEYGQKLSVPFKKEAEIGTLEQVVADLKAQLERESQPDMLADDLPLYALSDELTLLVA